MFWDINDDFIYHVAIKVNFSCTYTFFFVPLQREVAWKSVVIV